MKKLFLLLLLPSLCFAQYSSTAPARFSVGVGVDFVLPITSGFKDFYNIGYGGTIRGEYAVTPNLSAMLTAGYIVMTAKEILPGITPDNGSMIPVVIGAKYYLMPGPLRFYAAFDLGITSFSQAVGIAGVDLGNVTSTEFTWEPQLGVVGNFADNAAFDLGVRWIGISNANSLGIRLGVLFGVGGGVGTTGTGY